MRINWINIPEVHVPVIMARTHEQKEPQRLLEMIHQHREAIIERMNDEGGVLFRGFSGVTVNDFSNAIDALDLGARLSTSDYELPRTLLAHQLYTSSDLPAHIPLPLHHEKPRSSEPPTHLYFCCETPAVRGGETIFADASAIWRDMPKPIQDKILKHGVMYKQCFHGQSFKSHWLIKILGKEAARFWHEQFGVEDKALVEQTLLQDGTDWEWINDDQDLCLFTHLPGVLAHPVTHKWVWFNSVSYLNYYSNVAYGELRRQRFLAYLACRYLIMKDFLPLVCHYGNGLAFSSSEISEIHRILKQHAWGLRWQRSDFMVVDNWTLMHGKRAHEGARLLYSDMTK